MRVFIFTYDRYDTISTPALFEGTGIDYTVLCHTDEAREKFIQGGRVKPDRLIASHAPKGLCNNRNAALEMMAEGEWALFLVDDMLSVTELDTYDEETGDKIPVDTTNTTHFSRKFRKQASMHEFMSRADEVRRMCLMLGASLGGFAAYNNPLFRANKWVFNILADGRALVVKKTDLRWDTNVQTIDDYCFTAQNLQRFGTVVVNKWVEPKCSRYTKGGYGSMESRMELRRKDVKHLLTTYPNQIKVATKKGWPEGTHIRVGRFNNIKAVKETQP